MDPIEELLAREPEPNPRVVIGGNKPPTLIDELISETESFAEQAMLKIYSYERCEIIDDETSEAAVLLIGQMKELIEEIENARFERKEPFLRDGRVVDTHFHSILTPLAGPDHKKKLGGAAGDLLARIDAYRKKKDAEVEAERRRLEEAARKEREQAEQAAAVLQSGGISQAEFDKADLARRRMEDSAAALEAKAAATVARPIDSTFGVKTYVRKVPTVVIDNLEAAIKHCMVLDAGGVQAYVMSVYQKQVRAGVPNLPGARIVEDTTTGIRRK
jgi:hypothetical protein